MILIEGILLINLNFHSFILHYVIEGIWGIKGFFV